MKLSELVEKVIFEVTDGNSLPISPKEERIISIIEQAKKYFYQYWDDAKQTEYMVISQKLFHTELFKKSRTIKLPPCVKGILSLNECGADWINYNVNPDYKSVSYSMLNSALTGNSDNMVYAVVQASWFDFVRSNFVLKTVAFSYNNISNILKIEARSNLSSLAAQVSVTIPEESLYDSILFFDYVVGMCRKSVGRIFSTSDLKLLGRSTFNTQQIAEEGKSAVDAIKAEIKDFNDNDVAWFMMDGKYVGD